jgi:glycosyltransferase involved in cell wall biosynthesis
MAARRPVIATRVGGVTKLVLDGETGLLVEPRDVSGLRDAMLRCLREPQFAMTLGKKAEEHVRNSFSSEAMAKNYLEFYCQAIHARVGKPVASLQEV